MRRKLIISGFSMVAIIILIVAGNQVIIKLFANFSQKLITEYHELHSLQDLKVALTKTGTYLNFPEDHSTPLFHQDLENSLNQSRERMNKCKEVLSEIHKGRIWTTTIIEFDKIETISEPIARSSEIELEEIVKNLNGQITLVISNIDKMVDETLVEITEYELRNKRVVQHGTITVLAFGLSLIIFMALAGMGFIKKLTRPIDQLVNAMKKISKGNTDIRVNVDSDDEFLFLADSFNSMLEEMNKTTVSKEFFSKILNNLYGAVVVTNQAGKISFINDSACKLLKCDHESLLGQDSINLFHCKPEMKIHVDENTDIESYASQMRQMTEMRSSKGELIPVYVTCTILKDSAGTPNSMIIVGHDLTEEKANEEKIEKVRKERLIAINEAEENERIRIAKDLHDGLGQILTGISYSIQNIKPSNPDEIGIIEKIEVQINSAIQEAKNISHNLTPVILRDFGLVAAIENHVSKINQLNKTNIIFNSYDFSERIDPRLEKALFRISQEALHNIIKHADAESATIELFREYKQIALVIEDNGQGFDESKIEYQDGKSGIGLISMRERVYVFDGTLSIHSQLGRGTEIVVEVPCFQSTKIDEENTNSDS